MEKAQIKEQLKSVLRAVFDSTGLTAKNDKWITIKPNGEDGKGKHLLLKDGETPKEAIERTYGNGEKSDTKDKQSEMDTIEAKIKENEKEIPKNYKRDTQTKALWLYKNNILTGTEYEKVKKDKATNSITEFLEKGVKMEQFIETFKNIFAAGYSAANEAKEKEEEAENKCKNEEVDKRKLIDEVAGMMKSAGCSDEIIKTAIKDMEKESYDKSEAGTADNSKAKNEEEKADKEDKKADNAEEEKKEEEYKEMKEKTEEEAMNKAKNEIFGEASANKSSYISREERIELGMKY